MLSIQVFYGDYIHPSTGFSRYDERHEFLNGNQEDAITVAIIDAYKEIRDKFGGELGAVRAWLQEQEIDWPEFDDVIDAARECYAAYLTGDLEIQAQHDQDISGVCESIIDYVEYVEESGDEYDKAHLDQYRDAAGELDMGALDLADRIESLGNVTYPLTDKRTGQSFYFWA